MPKIEIEILGSGTSMGVPMAGCECDTCRSQNPKDKRLRTSALIKTPQLTILIDTSVDYRQQMLNAGVRGLDAVLYTHHHVDHILGMDDLRSFNIVNRKQIPLYGLAETMDNIKRVFSYVFCEGQAQSKIPDLSVNIINDEPFMIGDVEIVPIPLMHGNLPILGFRISDFAYCTDVSAIPEASYERLRGTRYLILNALRFTPHPTHFSVDEAVMEAEKIGAEKTYLTHISHAIMHDDAEAKLPESVRIAYDGLKLEL